ncbi:DUF1800 domain-containing protein [Hydrocarboniphaga sp.]|uniref:DUF1800 domain-containing protein n=1 Tax=Hydrocarboniphaga sp. TaxID=2033016 RepID=UPI003D1052C1
MQMFDKASGLPACARAVRPALLAVVVLLLSACGGGNPAPDSPVAEAPTPQIPVPSVPVPDVPVPEVPTPEIPAPDVPVPDVPVPEEPAPTGMGPTEAARLLSQSTFGPTYSEIQRLAAMSTPAYVDEQLALPPSLHLPECRLDSEALGMVKQHSRLYSWWKLSLTAPDQLRQRVALALSEIMVVSDISGIVDASQEGLCQYYDLLIENAFGNYRPLIEKVALTPQMGRYLSMFRNRKPNPVLGRRADENFAREVMQLFSIGTVLLNPDATTTLDGAGKPIDSYTQEDIQNLARVFTGWSWAGSSFGNSEPAWLVPMQAFDEEHDTDSKVLVGGVNVPAGGTAAGDMAIALDTLFQHPNLAPFISRQLIQKLVTSNPSADYVRRIAAVFGNNGSGVRGDLGAVVRAILLDDEARRGLSVNPNFGKVREPLLRQSHLWRALEAKPALNGRYSYSNALADLGQQPLSSPSVFNFFSPGYAPQGEILSGGLVAPEFQLADESRVTGLNNRLYQSIYVDFAGNKAIARSAIRVDLSALMDLAADVPALIDRLDLLLMSGQMSGNFRTILSDHLQTISVSDDAGCARVQDAVYLVMSSPQYAVQH